MMKLKALWDLTELLSLGMPARTGNKQVSNCKKLWICKDLQNQGRLYRKSGVHLV
jgi:hypothetical protein